MSDLFDWMPFYSTFADKLREFKNNRKALVEIICNAFKTIDMPLPTLERQNGQVIVPVDIDPFTVFGLFNKQIKQKTRISLCKAFAEQLSMTVAAPSSFDGVPVLNNQKATFYYFLEDRSADDINHLWDFFEAALDYAEMQTDVTKEKFITYYNQVLSQKGIKWNITIALFWIRPTFYLSLDGRNRWLLQNGAPNRIAAFLQEKKRQYFPESFVKEVESFKEPPTAEQYLVFLATTKKTLLEAGYQDVSDFSYCAYTISEMVNQQKKEEKSKKGADKESDTEAMSWFPADYTPGLSVEDWVKLLNDTEVFTPSKLEIILRIKDFGGVATCKQLAEKYGETANFYNAGSSALAKRIHLKTKCPIFEKNTEDARWWPILYVGQWNDNKDVAGSYFWKLRPELSEALEQVDFSNVRLYALPRESKNRNSTYIKADFLLDVFMTSDRYDALVQMVRMKKNVILQGAPGVGKTFAAKRLAYSMMGEEDNNRIEMVQFHQNYSYEDFVMGYKPEGASFALKQGVFYRFCQKAMNDPARDYFFIIDEINRGNMSKIFGELLMLIEKDYRGTSMTLAYSDVPFYVPKNVHLVGMMNTADRSLAMIDYALRRRFSFFDIAPGFDSDGFKRIQQSLKSVSFDNVVEILKRLNHEIANDPSLGKGFCIGHSYLCDLACGMDDYLKNVIEFDILPMLAEYWFDEMDKYERWAKELMDVFQ